MSLTGISLLAFASLFPGLSYCWAYSHQRSLHILKARDWVLRYAGVSAFWLAVGAWPLHWIYSTYWEDMVAGESLPPLVYVVPFMYLAVPAAAGWVAGWVVLKLREVSKTHGWVEKLLGSTNWPTSWDYLFDRREAGFIRCRLRSKRWVGGLFDKGQGLYSYASDGKVEQDIYIAAAVEFEESGAVKLCNNEYIWTEGGIYLRSSEIETLEFIPINPKGQPRKDGVNG